MPQSREIWLTKMQKSISEEHILRYLSLTKKAIAMVEPGHQPLPDAKQIFADFLDMAKRYCADAGHFYKVGNWVNALAAVNYAHAWLDAGTRIGVFDVHGDCRLFAADEQSPGQTKPSRNVNKPSQSHWE